MDCDSQKILEGLSRQDPAAQAAFVKYYWGMAYSVAYRTLRFKMLAADATVIALANAIKAISRDGFQLEKNLGAYVCKCARNKAITMNRKEMSEISLRSEGHVNPPPYAITQEERAAIRKAIEKCLHAIPPDRRQLIILCVIEQHSQRESAAKLGVSVGTINGWLQESKPMFKDCILRSGVYKPRVIRNKSK